MSGSAFDKPPYFDWRIDRWKIGLIVLLFLALLLGTFVDPQRRSIPEWTAGGPLEPDAAPAAVAGAQPPVQAEAMSADPAEPAASEPEGFSLPLTLASLGPNSVTTPRGLVSLSGTARPGDQVEVRSQQIVQSGGDGAAAGSNAVETLLGVAIADSRGLWTLPLETELEPGQHVLSLFELDSRDEIVDASSPVVITVLAEGEEGPPSLATPSVRFPTAAARVPSGRVTFEGSGLAGTRVRLFLDGRTIAEETVDAQEQWRITPDEELLPGVYVLRVAALDHRGEIVAESPPVAFAVLEAVENAGSEPAGASPVVPLAVTGAVLGSGGGALTLTGRATPHSTISAWHEQAALLAVNASIEGGWRMWLADASDMAQDASLSVRSDLSETVYPRVEVVGEAVAPFRPILLSPREGDVIVDGQPVLLGLAQPDSEISLRLNSTVVAMMVADPRGQWAYQPPEPLPAGELSISAYAGNALVQAVADGTTVYVTVASRS